MKCPICEIDLIMSERQGIEIDYCSKCRGVWLDRGELDKLIEKSAGDTPQVAKSDSMSQTSGHRGYQDNHDSYKERDKHYPDNDYYKKKHKKEGFLGELFDF